MFRPTAIMLNNSFELKIQVSKYSKITSEAYKVFNLHTFWHLSRK